MNDRPIRVGDLVIVVRGTNCCNYLVDLGKPFTVAAIASGYSYCNGCQKARTDTRAIGTADKAWYAEENLKLVDPPAEGETREAYKELST